jgi:hypothetical protein
MRIKVAIISLILCAISILCPAQSKGQLADTFYWANSYYEQGDFGGATAQYEQIISSGHGSGNNYYNLGNSYVKLKMPGKAILNYERALRFMPSDEDLIANHAYAVSLIQDPINPPSKMILWEIADTFSKRFTVNKLASFLSFLFILCLAAILFWRRFKFRLRYLVMVCSAAMVIILIGSTGLVRKIILSKGQAIVVAQMSPVRYEPISHTPSHFTVYEGMKVKIISCRGQWCKIRCADGKAGWVKKGDLEVI